MAPKRPRDSYAETGLFDTKPWSLSFVLSDGRNDWRNRGDWRPDLLPWLGWWTAGFGQGSATGRGAVFFIRQSKLKRRLPRQRIVAIYCIDCAMRCRAVGFWSWKGLFRLTRLPVPARFVSLQRKASNSSESEKTKTTRTSKTEHMEVDGADVTTTTTITTTMTQSELANIADIENVQALRLSLKDKDKEISELNAQLAACR